MDAPPDPHHIDTRIRAHMRRLVRRIHAGRLHARSARAWLACAAIAACIYGLAWVFAWPTAVVGLLVATPFLACAWIVARWWQAPITDYRAAADVIERAYPELGHALRTAIEQQPDASGRYSFLQTRLLTEVLEHAYRHFWSRSPLPSAQRSLAAHAASLLAACAVVALAARHTPPDRGAFAAPDPAEMASGLEITPGDTEVERGTTVVIAARFGESVPADAHLSWRSADGVLHREPMARSLADPVFATTLPHLAGDIAYTVEFPGGASREHRITVFDLPRVVRGDATLEYPAFTELAPRTIEDTRRISAVEGTQLGYSIQANKSVRQAQLRAPDGTIVPLTAEDELRTRFRIDMAVERSARYTIQLVDDAGRTNPDPPELRIEALPNRRPDLKLAFPRGDQRVSPLEEIALEASAADDFGLLDYGIAWSLAGEEPDYVSSHEAGAATTALREASFQRLLSLEALGAEPSQLFTWFAWADDMGSDGTPRRTRGDLFFAEVRDFDEVFREGEGGNRGQQGGAGGGEAAELLEMQRDISLAIWKLREQTPATDAFHEDVTTVLDAQEGARRLLSEAAMQLRERTQRAAAEDADGHMGATVDRLDEAREESAADPLDEAWTSSQRAYQALLRLQPPESQVGRERNNSGGQRGGRANQRQLDQLRFKDNEDRYEMESEAQLSSTPEEREQMQTLARLRELARRQSDLNERLQQLQTALEAANDEAERDEIRRELRRLEEEQRRMLADLDEMRQRMDQQSPGTQSAEAREQVERTREDMRRASESLQEGAVSRALASGTRAEENLEQARDSLRQQSASQFADEMREVRREARELAEAQERTARELEESQRQSAPSLDNSGERSELAQAMDAHREALDELTRQLRHVTEESEEAEPGLHRQLYDLLREQGQGGGTSDRLETASELLRRGFTDQARELQPQITESLDRLARGVERAAESVLGDEANTMRFAQAELDDLARSLRDGKPGSPESETSDSSGGEPEDQRNSARGDSNERASTAANTGGNPGGSASTETAPAGGDAGDREADALSRALAELGGAAGGGSGADTANPITGDGFAEWEERLRTVEALLDDPGARERLATARELGATLRREYRRHASPPLQTTIESGIVAPLNEVRAWLRQELARRDDPTSLQPVDRDPVPDAYAESVQRYYEALGE